LATVASLVIGLAGFFGLDAGYVSTASAQTSSCMNPNPGIQVFGQTKGTQLLDTAGRQIVPYGMTVYGLSTAGWATAVNSDLTQIANATAQWCTNFIRIQLGPPLLFNAQGQVVSAYLTAIGREVQAGLNSGDNVMLSAQYENLTNQFGPTTQTVRFWQVITSHYGTNPRIWYDLFNEPNVDSGAATGTVWSQWLNGYSKFLGMQTFAADVRKMTNSLLIIEGPYKGATLRGLPQYDVNGVPNIAYGVHPYGQTSISQWRTYFGNAATRVPIVVEEWGQWEHSGPSCYPNAASVVPTFFSYLRYHGLGLGAWSLVPGVLVKDEVTFTPTTINANYACVKVAASAGQGAGRSCSSISTNTAAPACSSLHR
jgi:hypothetical protein